MIDSTGALELDGIPQRLLVLGGGIIGLEMACVYHELGSQVSVVELLDQLIPGADADIVKPLTRRITKQYQDDLGLDQGHRRGGRTGRAHRLLRGRRKARPAVARCSTRSWSRSGAGPTAS